MLKLATNVKELYLKCILEIGPELKYEKVMGV
jgi:hypothetical protein